MEINTDSAVTRTRKVRVAKAPEPKPGKATPKSPAVKSVGKSAAKTGPARKAATKSVPKAVPKSTSRTTPKPETLTIPAKRKAVPKKPVAVAVDLAPLIATAAYFMAEHRHFAPGQELQDWFAAEQMIRAAQAS